MLYPGFAHFRREMIVKHALIFSLFLALTGAAGAQKAANAVVVGVNAWYQPPLQPGISQEGFIKQLTDNGVKTIRMGLAPRSVAFIIQAYRHGIETLGESGPCEGSNVKGRSSWSDVPLSECNPERFRAWFKDDVLDQLEAAGVRLTGIQLGTEINAPGMNGDFANPGSGRVLGLADLNNPKDPEGPAVAAGFRIYIQVAAALKDVRDHSKLNQHTPIIAAGMANWGRPGPKSWDGIVGVSLPDAIQFMQQNGLDPFVDGYAVHIYPGLDPSRSAATRIASMGRDIFPECRAEKPCWVTEYGIPNADQKGNPDHCPIDDRKRLKVIKELRKAFQYFANQGRLAGIIYYDWSDYPGKEAGIFRCGALTDAGKLALSPM